MISLLLVASLVLDIGWTLHPIRGTYHAWWVILNLPKDSVSKMVTDFSTGVQLADVPWPDYPTDQHPVILEIGREMNCGPIDLPMLRSDFLEFKFDIPFVQIDGKTSNALNFKAKLYENSEINAESSDIFYGLDAGDATMSMTNNSYDIIFNGLRFHGNFTPSISQPWGNRQSYTGFNVYETAMNIPWFGSHGLKSSKPCSNHFYDFKDAKIRPASASIVFDPSILTSDIPQNTYHAHEINKDNPYGAIEILTNFTMSFPGPCTK